MQTEARCSRTPPQDWQLRQSAFTSEDNGHKGTQNNQQSTRMSLTKPICEQEFVLASSRAFRKTVEKDNIQTVRLQHIANLTLPRMMRAVPSGRCDVAARHMEDVLKRTPRLTSISKCRNKFSRMTFRSCKKSLQSCTITARNTHEHQHAKHGQHKQNLHRGQIERQWCASARWNPSLVQSVPIQRATRCYLVRLFAPI